MTNSSNVIFFCKYWEGGLCFTLILIERAQGKGIGGGDRRGLKTSTGKVGVCGQKLRLLFSHSHMVSSTSPLCLLLTEGDTNYFLFSKCLCVAFGTVLLMSPTPTILLSFFPTLSLSLSINKIPVPIFL